LRDATIPAEFETLQTLHNTIIDTHHHLWQASRGDYFWMDSQKDPSVAPNA
jgi:predicted TIM-barrel fold metal-dependent hydrolase